MEIQSGGDLMSKGKIAIIGIGEVPTQRNPNRTHWDIIYDTCMEARRPKDCTSFYSIGM